MCMTKQDSERLLQKMKELALSKMGILLLAGVLLFLLANLLSGEKTGLFGFGGGSLGGQEDGGGGGGLGGNEGSLAGGAISSTTGGTGQSAAEAETLRYLARQEERLKAILEQVEGIGKVEVMMSLSSSRERVVLSEHPYSQRQIEENDSAGGTRKTTEVERGDTTVYGDGGSSQAPFVVKELEPELSGVLVLAQGAGSDTVKAEIVEAVEALFGLPAHRIKVIKRRG